MELLEVTVQGFGPFTEAVTVPLTGQPGLVFVAGRNEEEPRLGANGAGKSKLFEAVYWCLFGKTSRNLKAGEVANWYAELPCVVDVRFRREAEYVVRRVWQQGKMNQLSLIEDDVVTEVDQKRIEEVVGLNETEFLFSMYFAQHASYFIDLSPSDQLELYAYALSIDYWERLAGKASKKASEAEEALQYARLAKERATAYLKEKQAKLEEYEEQAALEIRERQHGAVAVWNQIRELKLPPGGDLEAMRELKAMIRAAEKGIADAKLDQRDYQRQLRKLDDWKNSIHDMKVCELCRQRMPHTQLARDYEKERDTLLKDIADTEKTIGDLVDTLDEAQALYDVEEKRDAARAKAQDQKERLESELHTLIKQPLRFTELVLNAWEEVEDAGLRYAEDKDKAYGKAEELEACKFWTKGFKDIRLFVIDESLAQLEFEVNSALHDLGLEEWRVEFNVEKETKSGTIKRGFTIQVYSAAQEEPVNVKAYSGGEMQRVRIACAIGFSSLIQQHKGVECKTEFWDEPSAALSDTGIDDLLRQLSDRARKQGKRVFLADHRSLHFGDFVDKLTVVKARKGSYVEA